MKKIGLALIASVFCLGFLANLQQHHVLYAQNSWSEDFSSERDDGHQIVTIDRFVPHISTSLANQGEQAHLFLRERVRRGHHHSRGVVLIVAGATVPIVPGFDLPFRNYSWMDFLARAGFDVFAMDVQGYGLSARSRMDDPCNTQPSQQALLVPTRFRDRVIRPISSRWPFNRIGTKSTAWLITYASIAASRS